MCGDIRGYLRRDAPVASVYGSNGVDQVGADHRLQHITHCTHLQRLQCLNIPRIGGKHNNACVGEFFTYCAGRLDSVHLRHPQVHQGNIRQMLAIGLQRFQPICTLSHQLHIRLILDSERYAVADKRMVVNTKNSDPFRNGHEPSVMKTLALILLSQLVHWRFVSGSSSVSTVKITSESPGSFTRKGCCNLTLELSSQSFCPFLSL